MSLPFLSPRRMSRNIGRRGARYSRLCDFCGVLKAALLAITVASSVLSPARAVALRPHELVPTDPWSGAAIAGYDPVAFFVDNRARPGDPRFYLVHAGTLWHFANSGNRAAFEEHPEAYLPAFGGYDPQALASGLIVAGRPQLFLIRDSKLYLFRTERNRALFEQGMQAETDAEKLWPELRRQLSP